VARKTLADRPRPHIDDLIHDELRARLIRTGLTGPTADIVITSVKVYGLESPHLGRLESVAREMIPAVSRVLDTYSAVTWETLAENILPALRHRLNKIAEHRRRCVKPRRCRSCHRTGNPPPAPAWAAEHRRRTRRRHL
jgi:hypothetical protein